MTKNQHGKNLQDSSKQFFFHEDSTNPLPGLESDAIVIMGFIAQSKFSMGYYEEAEELSHEMLKLCSKSLNENHKDNLSLANSFSSYKDFHNFLASYSALGIIRQQLGKADCINIFRSIISLAIRNLNQDMVRVAAYNLGCSLLDFGGFDKIIEAKECLEDSLALCSPENKNNRSQCLVQLGRAYYEENINFLHIRENSCLMDATLYKPIEFMEEALSLIDGADFYRLGRTHSFLGNAYMLVDPSKGLWHFQQSLLYKEKYASYFDCALSKKQIALAFLKIGRYSDAKIYAISAKQTLEVDSTISQDSIEDINNLINYIDELIKSKEAIMEWSNIPTSVADILDKISDLNKRSDIIEEAIKGILTASSNDRMSLMYKALDKMSEPVKQIKCRIDNELLGEFLQFCSSKSLRPNVILCGALMKLFS